MLTHIKLSIGTVSQLDAVLCSSMTNKTDDLKLFSQENQHVTTKAVGFQAARENGQTCCLMVENSG